MRAFFEHLSTHPKTALLSVFFSGAALTFGFAPLYCWPVIFISLPLFYELLVTSASRAQALWRSFFFGYGFFMAGTWWIGNALLIDAAKFGWMLPFSILGLSAVMALWFLPFGYLIYRFRSVMNPAIFTILWVLIEILRSVGPFGFPWNLAGYIGLASLSLAQVASIIGVYGLGLFIVWLGLLPIYWLKKKPRRHVASIVCAVFVLSIYGYGAKRLDAPTQFTETMLRVVQPNIPQEIKGTREGVDWAGKALGKLTSQESSQPIDAMIWPETSYPFTIRADGPVIVPQFSGILLTGAVRAEGFKPDIKIWNSLIALTHGGDILATYDKHQLVPFGEFVPLRSVLPLEKITPGDIDFSRGAGAQTITINKLPPFSPLVCYEGIFPWLAVDKKNRPAWMLNVTNDGWYGDSPGPYQHFEMVRMRAIEQGLPMVRAANSGVSAVIDARGRIVSKLGLNQQGVIDVKLPVADLPTPYSKIF